MMNSVRDLAEFELSMDSQGARVGYTHKIVRGQVGIISHKAV